MQRRRLHVFTCVSVFIALLVVGCSPITESGGITDYESSDKLVGILYFSSADKLYERIAYTDAQREELEKKSLFKSFAAISEEIYEQFDFENCKSVEEIETFVEKNKEYIEVVTGANGEPHVQPKLYYHPYKHIIDEQKCFLMDDRVFKVFDDGILFAAWKDPDKTGQLMRMENASSPLPDGIGKLFEPVDYTEMGTPVKSEEGLAIKRNASPCTYRLWSPESSVQPGYIGTSTRTWYQEEGKHYFEVCLNILVENAFNAGPNHPSNRSYSGPSVIVTAKRKTLGMWFLKRQTLHLDYSITIWSDFSGKVIVGPNDHMPILQDDTYTYTNTTYDKELRAYIAKINQGNWLFNAGTMNYRFYATSSAVSKAVDVTFNAYTFYYYCLDK